jgi:serine/threonine-protein kinase
VPAAGGPPQTLTTVDSDREMTHRLPHVVAGGKAVVFTAMRNPSGLETHIEWLSVETGRRKLLVDDAADGRYVPTGHLVFVRRGALMAVPFDLAAVRTTGSPVTVVPRVMQAFNTFMPDMNSGAGQYSLSETGALIWASGGTLPDNASHLYWIERSGRAQEWTAFGARPVSGLRLSPDGRRLAFNTGGLDRGVFVYDIERNSTTRLTSDGREWYGMPFWTPDGTRVGFTWSVSGLLGTWWMPAAAKGKIERLWRADLDQRASGWSRDGRYLALVEGYGPPRSGVDVKVLRMADRRMIPLAASKADEAYPDFSPDSRWLAYVSNETGRNEVYVRSFPDGKRTVQITTAGGTAPAWAPGGRELFYFDLAFKKLLKADIAAGETLSASPPQPLFEFSAAGSSAVRTYDVTPDGRRFLIRKAPGVSPVSVTEVLLERQWSDTLKRAGTH